MQGHAQDLSSTKDLRLYVVVRGDMSPGMQMAQAVHASFAFSHDHKTLVDPWLLKSNYLVIVQIPDEDSLLDFIRDAHQTGIPKSAVREPDLNNEVTALALAPGLPARKLCSRLPLALREVSAV